MGEVLVTSYVLTKLELEILLNRMGCESLYGFFDKNTADTQRVYTALSSLVGKGLLTSDGDRFLIQAELREIIRCMTLSNLYIRLSVGGNEMRDYICYRSQDCFVISSESLIRPSSVTVGLISRDTFYQSFLPDLLSKDADEKNFVVEFSAEENILQVREDENLWDGLHFGDVIQYIMKWEEFYDNG